MKQNTHKTSIGGQAVIEGVMMRGPDKSVLAVRNTKGEIIVEDLKNHSKPFYAKIPILRGIISFVTSLTLGYKAISRSAELSGLEDDDGEDGEQMTEKQKKNTERIFSFAMILSMVFGVVLSMGLFVYLPEFLFGLIRSPFNLNSPIYLPLFTGIIRFVLFIIYLLAVSQMKDIKRIFQYHGAEHKTIFCYEQKLPLTVENVRTNSRFHPRCGTSFLLIVMIIALLVYMIPFFNSTFIYIYKYFGINHQVSDFKTNMLTSFIRFLVKLPFLPLIAGLSYEIIKFAGRHENLFTRILSAPGMWLQGLTTKEPDDSQIEVAIKSLEAVIPRNSDDDKW